MFLFTIFIFTAWSSKQSPTLTRFAFIVGSNKGTIDRGELKYAVSDAQSMADILLNLGGLSEKNLIMLKDPNIDTFKDNLNKLTTKIKQYNLENTRKEVIFYYSGHANEKGIIFNNDVYSYKKLRATIDSFSVDVRIAILDACASGGITREKGGKSRPPFLIDASTDMQGYAYLTSSSHDEAAQESDRIKSSFFTHYLLSGLRGGADRNGDGKITLNEAYEFAFHETLHRTETTNAGPQHAAYDIRLKGSGDLVMTDLRASSAGLRLAPSVNGRVFIRKKDGTLLAEINKINHKQIELGLEPDEYIVTIDKTSKALRKTVILERDKYYNLFEKQMFSVNRDEVIVRGNYSDSYGDTAEYHKVPLNISIVPQFSLTNKYDKVTSYSSIGLLASFANRSYGIDLSSGATITSDLAKGAQLAALCNVVNGTLEGIQLSGVTNVVGNDVDGVQLTGGVNVASQGMNGFQFSGISNMVGGEFNGVQMGTVNFAGNVKHSNSMSGLQMGVVNFARNVNGLQFGVVNVCDSIKGASIGVFSFVKSYLPRGRVWIDESKYLQAGFRTGTENVYTIMSLGARLSQYKSGWSIGYGLGLRKKLGRSFIALENMVQKLNEDEAWDSDQIMHWKMNLLSGFYPMNKSKRFNVFGGPTGNFYLSKKNKDKELALWDVQLNKGKNNWYAVWLGFTVGLEF